MKQPASAIFSAHERLTHLVDADEVFKGLARLLKSAVGSSWLAVYLYDRDSRDFAPGHGYGLPSRFAALFRNIPVRPEKLAQLKSAIRKRQQVLLTGDSAHDLATPLLARLLRKHDIHIVPMIVRQQLLGAVCIARDNGSPPLTEEETAFMHNLVSHAAIVVSHIRLFDESLDLSVEMAKRIDIIATLDEINKAISSSLSPARIIETAMENIERIIRCTLTAILVEEHGKLVVMAVRSDGLAIPAVLQQGAGVTGRSLAATAAASRSSRYIFALSDEKHLHRIDRQLARGGIESLLATPLVSKEKVTGVLLLGDHRRSQFLREDAFTIEKIAAQMAVALENARLYEEMRTLFISTVATLANAIDAKSPWTKGHSERVMGIAVRLAEEMKLPEEQVERIRLGGLLHDIGKIGVIEALLEKPEQLSEDEFPPIRLHPVKGVEILAPIEQLQDILPGIRHHHERFDGSGYPDGLRGEDIPLEARIIAVADAFDAMVATRPYKTGWTVARAREELQRCAGSQFDPRVVASFCAMMARTKKAPG
jgi:HD-GYP domain-containing protein (c-di-GMP phosphodiesterase class II)